GAQTILFLAGQVSYEKDGTAKARGGFTAQARHVLSFLKALVEAGGGTLDNVVKITTYVTDVRYRPEFRAVRDEFFGTKGPASTMIDVSKLAHPDYLIEVGAVRGVCAARDHGHAALDHPLDAAHVLKHGDVVERVAVDEDEVGLLALLDRANLPREPQGLGGLARHRLQRLHGRQHGGDQQSELGGVVRMAV